jgi:molecular chaperone DnaJ
LAKRDYYEVLGVDKNATEADIKKAFRKKAKECHPDLHPNDPNAARKMNELNEAYDMLMNPEKYAKRQQQQNPYGQSYGNPYGQSYGGQSYGQQGNPYGQQRQQYGGYSSGQGGYQGGW